MKNYMIINIEGLDVAGKETLAKNIKEYIKKHISKEDNQPQENVGFQVHIHSFPTYESNIGGVIQTILTTVPVERRNQEYLDMAFAYDRLDVMNKYLQEFAADPKCFHVLILDRYYMSNLIYSLAAGPIIENKMKTDGGDIVVAPLPEYILEHTAAGRQYMIEQNALPHPDVMYMMYRKTENGKKIHEDLIKSKSETDMNENLEFQAKLNFIIHEYIHHFIERYLPCGVIYNSLDIGSNFGNTQVEEQCYSYIVSRLYNWMKESLGK